MIIHIH